MVWSVLALVWLIGLQLAQIEVPGWIVPKLVSNTVIASIVLDFVLAGSELFHRIWVKLRAGKTVKDLEMEFSLLNHSSALHSETGVT